MVLHPRHRGDCADFFVAPDQTVRMEFAGPVAVIDEIEHAAALAGRTFSTQFTYIMALLLGRCLPDFDDGRSVEDWRTLLNPCTFRVSEAAAWTACTRLWRTTPRPPVTA